MAKKHRLSMVLAVIGTVLVLLPIAAMLVTGVVGTISSGGLRVDYLMPAELGLVVLVGGAALLAAALWVRRRVLLTAWTIAVAIVTVVLGQLLAVVTGLASGRTEPSGWPLALVIAMILAYDAAVLALGIGGILLCGDISRLARSS